MKKLFFGIFLFFTVFLFENQNAFCQEQFKNIDVVLVNEHVGGSVAYFDYTTDDRSKFLNIDLDLENKIKEELKYKIRMAQLETNRKEMDHPQDFLALNFEGKIFKLDNNVFLHTGAIKINQFVLTRESKESIFITTWVENFSEPSSSYYQAQNAIIKDMEEACDDFLKDYFKVN